MVMIGPQALAKISQRCSGQAMKVAIDGADALDIAKVLTQQGVTARIEDASSMNVLSDSMATIVTGLEDMSQTAFACFISHMDSLRFRNILIFPTKAWFESEECELNFSDRMGPAMMAKFKDRLTVIDLEGF